MFVYLPPRGRRHGAVTALLGAIALAGCTDPTEPSDLRTGGPAQVLTVLVNSADHRTGFTGASIENATFCKTSGPNDEPGMGDPKRPGPVSTIDTSIIQVCPDDLTMGAPEVTDAIPEAWYVRIEFDELLDPTIEDLIPVLDSSGNPTGTYTGTLVNTQPVSLQCDSINGGMVDVPYDGYYSPSGNSITYPLGPSIVIKPNNPSLIATTSACQISLHDNILDKTEIPVPPDQRGPYTFAIDSIRVAAISPSDKSMVDPAAAGVDLTFNTKVDFTSMNFDPTMPPTTFNFSPDGRRRWARCPKPTTSCSCSVTSPPRRDRSRSRSTPVRRSRIRCGVTTTFAAASKDTLTQTSFTTNPIMLNGISGASEPGKKVQLSFNQYMDGTTLVANSNFTISSTPPLANMDIEDDGGNQTTLLVYGDYQLGTAYTFTLNANATIADCPGAEDFFLGPGSCVRERDVHERDGHHHDVHDLRGDRAEVDQPGRQRDHREGCRLGSGVDHADVQSGDRSHDVGSLGLHDHPTGNPPGRSDTVAQWQRRSHRPTHGGERLRDPGSRTRGSDQSRRSAGRHGAGPLHVHVAEGRRPQ